jgi:hypothetical protein
MSFWGSWMLTLCENDLTLNLSNHWLFPSEIRECLLLAEKLGISAYIDETL